MRERRERRVTPAVRPQLRGYLSAAAAVGAASLAIGAALTQVRIANVSMLYLVPVLAVAVRFGSGPAILASVAAFLTYNWFFIAPIHTFSVADPDEWIALLLFLVVAVVTAHLAAAQRRRAHEAQRREREAIALRDLSRILHSSDDLRASLQAVAEHLRQVLALSGCAVLLPERGEQGGRTVVEAAAGATPSAAELPGERAAEPVAERPAERAAEWLVTPAAHPRATRRWVRVRRPERETLRPGWPEGARVEFVPLVAGERTVGMLRLAAAAGHPAWSPEEERLIRVAAEQIGRTVERGRLREAATEAEVLRTTETARQAVLASVSHDLRTPLASIRASAEGLLEPRIRWSDEERVGLVSAILDESRRMSRLVEALLDMSRIEAGKLRPERGWYPLDSLVDDVVARLEPLTADHVLEVDVPESLPPVPLDYVQIGQALANLVENAARYTPAGSTIQIGAAQEGEWVRVTVADDGPGIPPEALPHVFEKFFRASGGDRARARGIGLGLAVARGYVEAHGGSIEVHSPPRGRDRGTACTVRLPLRPAGSAPPVPPAPPAPPVAAVPSEALVEAAEATPAGVPGGEGSA